MYIQIAVFPLMINESETSVLSCLFHSCIREKHSCLKAPACVPLLKNTIFSEINRRLWTCAPLDITVWILNCFLQVEGHTEVAIFPIPTPLQISALPGHTCQQSITPTLSLKSSEGYSRKGEVKELCCPQDPS